MGAYEFQGSSNDITPPIVTGVQPSGVHAGGSVLAPVSSISVSFSETIDLVSAFSPSLYQLVGDGIDGQFDTGDDVVIGIASIATNPEGSGVTLTLPSVAHGSLPTDSDQPARPGTSGYSG